METGKMKLFTYIIAFTMLASSPLRAQIATGVLASSILTNKIVLTDVNLKASFTNNAAQINWQPTNQIKVRRYQLEKSADGENFLYMVSFGGAEKNYTVADNNLFAGTNYYRLTIVDDNGNTLYSNIETVDTKANISKIKVLPTQLDEKLFVWVPSNTTISCATISGADGKLHRKAVINNNNNMASVEIKGLAAGVYSLSIQTNKGETVQLKFSKS